MWPELFRIGPFPISPYGILIAIGFFGGIWLAARLASRFEGIDPFVVWDFGITVVLVALLGAKILLIFTDSYYYSNPANILSIEFLRSAGVFYGGFLAALGWSVYYFRKHSLPGWRLADAFAPAIPLGHFFGRLGCFMAGCCHGRPTDSFLAVTFTDPTCMVEPAYLNQPLYPTQLLEAAGNLLISLGLLVAFRKRSFPGQMILAYAILYALLRFGLEFLRGDSRGWVVPDVLSTSHFIALVVFIAAVVAYTIRRRKTADAKA